MLILRILRNMQITIQYQEGNFCILETLVHTSTTGSRFSLVESNEKFKILSTQIYCSTITFYMFYSEKSVGLLSYLSKNRYFSVFQKIPEESNLQGHKQESGVSCCL